MHVGFLVACILHAENPWRTEVVSITACSQGTSSNSSSSSSTSSSSTSGSTSSSTSSSSTSSSSTSSSSSNSSSSTVRVDSEGAPDRKEPLRGYFLSKLLYKLAG